MGFKKPLRRRDGWRRGALAGLLSLGLAVSAAPVAAFANGGEADAPVDAPVSRTISGTVAIDPQVQYFGVQASPMQNGPWETYACSLMVPIDPETGHYSIDLSADANCDAFTQFAVGVHASPVTVTEAAPFGYAGVSYWAGQGLPAATQAFAATAVDLSQTPTVTGIDIAPLKMGEVTGTVLNTELTDLQVSGTQTVGSTSYGSAPALVGEDGSYRILLPHGTWDLKIADANSAWQSLQALWGVTVTGGVTTPGNDFDLGPSDPSVGATVAGTVSLAAGDSASNEGAVEVRPNLPSSDQRSYACGATGRPTNTGSYSATVTGTSTYVNCTGILDLGEYLVSYNSFSTSTSAAPYGYAASYWAGEGRPATAWQNEAVAVAAPSGATVSGIDIQAIANGRIAGVADVTGVTLDNYTSVFAWPAEQTFQPFGADTRLGFLDADGSYFIDLAPGEYTVALGKILTGMSGAEILQYFNVASELADADTVTVTSKQVTSDINFGDRPADPPVTAGAVSISGETTLGSTLTAATSGWAPGSTAFTYQWNRDGVPISGATGLTYALGVDDIGRTITVTATGSAAGFSPAPKTSAGVGPVTDTRPGAISVIVTDGADAPLAGAWVTLVRGGMLVGNQQSDGTGVVHFADVARGDYEVIALAPSGARKQLSTSIDEPNQLQELPVQLVTPELPASVEVEGAVTTWGEIGVTRGQAHQVSFTAAPGIENPTMTIQPGDTVVALVETSPGVYIAEIPAYQQTGPDGTFTVSATLGDEEISFDLVYIDPSGTVVDQYGTPVAGANVVLSRSETETGIFTAVPDQSDIMSPKNRTNPDISDADGAFGWDVIAGWYTVTAGASGASIATAPMQVVDVNITDLVLALPGIGAAPAATTAPEVSVVSGRSLTIAEEVEVSDGIWPAIAGETAPIEVLAYQWTRDGVDIEGATGTTYETVAADEGTDLAVVLTVGRQVNPAKLTGDVRTWDVIVNAGEVGTLPAPDAPAAADLAPETEGALTWTGTPVAGSSVQLTIGETGPAEFGGQPLFAWLMTEPEPTALGFAFIGSDGSGSFQLPAGVTYDQTIVVTDRDGNVVAWSDGFQIQPAAQFNAEDLTDGNRNGMSIVGPSTLAPGAEVTVELAGATDGDVVFGWMFSAPTPLQFATVATGGRATFTLPTGVSGDHRLAVTNPAGDTLLGWAPISFTGGSTPGVAGDAGTTATGLAQTGGADIAPLVVSGALALLLMGAGALALSRRRSRVEIH